MAMNYGPYQGSLTGITGTNDLGYYTPPSDLTTMGSTSFGGTPQLSEFDYLLTPQQEFRRSEAQRMGGQNYFGMTPVAQQALERRFNPLYGLYQAVEPSGQYTTFSDFLRERPDVSTQQIDAAVARAAQYQQMENPIEYALYYGGAGVGRDAAMNRQRQLAQTQLLGRMGQSAAFNPTLNRAAQGVIQQMYNNYLAGQESQVGSGGTFAQQGPTGFMDYYARRRGLVS